MLYSLVANLVITLWQPCANVPTTLLCVVVLHVIAWSVPCMRPCLWRVSGPSSGPLQAWAVTLIELLFLKASEQQVQFDPDKTEFIHFSNKCIPETATLHIGDLEIQPKSLVRWLGIWFDSKLIFKSHVEKRINSATAAFYGLARLTSFQKGLDFQSARRLYIACITIIADYGIQVWWRARNQKFLVEKYQKLQNIALRAMTGAFKGSPLQGIRNRSLYPSIRGPIRTALQPICHLYTVLQHTTPVSSTGSFNNHRWTGLKPVSIHHPDLRATPSLTAVSTNQADRDYWLQRTVRNTVPEWEALVNTATESQSSYFNQD